VTAQRRAEEQRAEALEREREARLAAENAQSRMTLLAQSMEVLTSFGDGGRQPGQFFAVHSIATDSKGNIFTTETYEGRRLQKFAFKGVGPVAKKDQGTVWPSK
jgi:hypothetical protein